MRKGSAGEIELNDFAPPPDENVFFAYFGPEAVSRAEDAITAVQIETRYECRNVVFDIIDQAEDLLPQIVLPRLSPAVSVAVVKSVDDQNPPLRRHRGGRPEDEVEKAVFPDPAFIEIEFLPGFSPPCKGGVQDAQQKSRQQ
jgi:hypothetical protein